jgi:hypothetical protein
MWFQPDEVLEIRRDGPHHQGRENETPAPEGHGSGGMGQGKGHRALIYKDSSSRRVLGCGQMLGESAQT